eukprot:Platyproteum_vivax@DN6262_c0_g1_i2.p1
MDSINLYGRKAFSYLYGHVFHVADSIRSFVLARVPNRQPVPDCQPVPDRQPVRDGWPEPEKEDSKTHLPHMGIRRSSQLFINWDEYAIERQERADRQSTASKMSSVAAEVELGYGLENIRHATMNGYEGLYSIDSWPV